MSARPNILVIQTDQQRVDTLRAYGGAVCRTPAIDRLAEEGIVFDRAYAVCPICTPARASLQTGLYPHNHRMMNNTGHPGCRYDELPDTPRLLSRRLASAGYAAGYTGKWHLGGADDALEEEPKPATSSLPTSVGYAGDDFPGHGGGGFRYPAYKRYLAENGLSLELANRTSGIYAGHEAAEISSPVESTVDYFLAERAITTIGELSRTGKPFSFQLNFWGPHEPYYAQSRFVDLYRDLPIEPWPNFHDPSTNKPSVHDVKRSSFTDWKDFVPYVRHYFASMSMIDSQIGRVLEWMRAAGLYDDTVILFTADHGESLGIHGGLCDKSMFMYEETCRIPLIVKPATGYGSPERGRRDDRFVTTCDLYSTVLDFAGLSREQAERDGRSLVRAIAGEPDDGWRDEVVVESDGLGSLLYSQRMIRHGDVKYVFNAGDTDELYDLADDPHELDNKVNKRSYQDTLLDMRRRLDGWLERTGDGLQRQFRLLRMR
jgi:arylsulfatase A-like enzyme